MILPPIDEDQKLSSDDASRINQAKAFLKKFDRNFLIAAAAAIVALILIVGYAIVVSVTSDKNTPPPPEQTTSQSPTPPSEASNAPPENESASPLVTDGIEFAEVASAKSPVTISVDGTTIKASQSGSPTLTLSDDSNVKAASSECKIKDTLSYCLVATTQFGAQSFSYFYSRDIAHSKMLRDASDVRQVEIDGAASAAFMTIDFGSQGPRRVLAIAAKDSSGYLVTLPEGSGTSTEGTLLKGIALK